MASNDRKQQIVKLIQKHYPDINEKGTAALMANFDIETDFKHTTENKYTLKTLENRKGNLRSMNKNLAKWFQVKHNIDNPYSPEAKAIWDTLSVQESNGVLYQGNEKATSAGGYGALQVTSANYGGLENFDQMIATMAKEDFNGMDPQELLNKVKNDYDFGVEFSLLYYKKYKEGDKLTSEVLNNSTPSQLRSTYINPGENPDSSAVLKTRLNQKYELHNNSDSLNLYKDTLNLENIQIPQERKTETDTYGEGWDTAEKTGDVSIDEDEMRRLNFPNTEVDNNQTKTTENNQNNKVNLDDVPENMIDPETGKPYPGYLVTASGDQARTKEEPITLEPRLLNKIENNTGANLIKQAEGSEEEIVEKESKEPIRKKKRFIARNPMLGIGGEDYDEGSEDMLALNDSFIEDNKMYLEEGGVIDFKTLEEMGGTILKPGPTIFSNKPRPSSGRTEYRNVDAYEQQFIDPYQRVAFEKGNKYVTREEVEKDLLKYKDALGEQDFNALVETKFRIENLNNLEYKLNNRKVGVSQGQKVNNEFKKAFENNLKRMDKIIEQNPETIFGPKEFMQGYRDETMALNNKFGQRSTKFNAAFQLKAPLDLQGAFAYGYANNGESNYTGVTPPNITERDNESRVQNISTPGFSSGVRGEYYGLENPVTDLSQLDRPTLLKELEDIKLRRGIVTDMSASGKKELELERLNKMQQDVEKELKNKPEGSVPQVEVSKPQIDLGSYSTEFLRGIQDGTESTLGMDEATVNAIKVLDLEKDNPNLTEDGQAVNLSEDVEIIAPKGNQPVVEDYNIPNLPETDDYVQEKSKAGKVIEALGGAKGIARGAMTLLALAEGRKNIKEAMKEIPVEEGHKLDGAWKGYMAKMREAAQSGMSAEQKFSAQSDLSTAYNLGVKNVARASGGNRAMFLANAGVLNANRIKGLLKLHAMDAKMQQDNLKALGKAVEYQNEHGRMVGEVDRKMAYDENTRQSALHGTLGNEFVKHALGEIAYATEKAANMTYMNAFKASMDQQNINSGLINMAKQNEARINQLNTNYSEADKNTNDAG